jgi:hypothetical protein
MLFNTPLDLERAAAAAARVWLGDMYLKSPLDLGAQPIQCAVYEGHVPMMQAGDQNGAPKAPSIAVRAQSANWHREGGEAHLSFAILTWDDNLSRMGYRDVENLSWQLNQDVYESVGIPAVLAREDGSFMMSDGNLFQLADHPTTFELIDDPSVDFFPYFLGVYTAVFNVPTPQPNTAAWNPVTPSFKVTTPGPPTPAPHS